MPECVFENCNRLAGHSGSHGIELEPGLILAPHGGDEGEISEPELCDLKCDCCGESLLMSKYESGGGHFDCPGCNQVHTFNPDGTTACIIATLFPSDMDKGSQLYRDFVEYRFSEWVFLSTGKFMLGMIDESEKNRLIAESRQKCDEALHERYVQRP